MEVLSKYDCMTVGETPGVDPVEALRTVGSDREELNMLFQFEHMGIDSEEGEVNGGQRNGHYKI